jgi:hypothetical protein
MNRIISYIPYELIVPFRPSTKSCNSTIMANVVLHSTFTLGLSRNPEIFPFYSQYAYYVYILNLFHITESLQVNLYVFY